MNISRKILAVILVVALTASMIAPLMAVNAQDNSLFSVTIIAPGNANLLRRQWSQIFASNLQKLGIDAKVVFLSWTGVYDRVFTPSEESVGKTFVEGGFDVQAVGWTPGLLPEPRQLHYGADPAFLAPTGQNYYLWDNAQSNALLDQFITSTDDAEKTTALKQWQQIFFSEVPASQIVYEELPVVVNPVIGNLYTPPTGGEGWLYFNAQPYPQLLTRSDGGTQIVYCSTGEIDSLNPPESNSWYDTIITSNIFGGLAQNWPTLSGINDLQVPDLLTSWSPSADGFTWTFHCREGVTWHDGVEFTADDILFSIWALMNGETGSQFAGYYQSVYGDKCTFTFSNGTAVTLGTGDRVGSITATDENTIVAQLPVLALGKPYGFFEPYMLTLANNIIPMHIFENIAPANWAETPFNTGQGSMTINGIAYTGPVGTGPYMWESYDVEGQSVHLERNDNYWNATALKNDGLFQIKDYYIRYIADKTSALAALKNGEVDILDAHYSMETDVPTIGSWGRVIHLEGMGRQEFGYNMRHPVFGTGVDTPLGKSDPARAAEAARYIRTAFDYAIPRQLIIDNLLSGSGVAGATPMLPTQPFYDTSITARPFDLEQAKNYLQMAGYNVGGIVEDIVSLEGILTDAEGSGKSGAVVRVMRSTENSTASLTQLAELTTDDYGGWSYADKPTEPATYYYYLLDTTTGEYTYLQSYYIAAPTPSPTEAPAADNTLMYVAVAIVVIVIVIVAVALLMRKKK
jgi:ABC-type transport system substrate-binding protein